MYNYFYAFLLKIATSTITVWYCFFDFLFITNLFSENGTFAKVISIYKTITNKIQTNTSPYLS